MAFQEKVALVTGAGSGVGRASSLALQEAGFQTVLVGRRMEPLQVTMSLGKQDGPRMHPLAIDVSRPQEVQSLFQSVQKILGRLDVLFNNAGLGSPPVLFEEIPFDAWQQVVNVNLTGAFLCAQEAVKMMKVQTPRGGRIINNGSISAYVPRPKSAPYTATKHAITGLTRSISLDGRLYNIACSQLDIGNAETPMTARMKEGVPQAGGEMKPEPVIDVKHCADAIVYMANLPLDANVQFMTIMATKMPFIGRG